MGGLQQDRAEIYKDKRLVGFSDLRTRTFWVFTMKGHPAHPALITRQLVDEGVGRRNRWPASHFRIM